MAQPYDDEAKDPAAIRRVIDETRDFVDHGLREIRQTPFGFSQDTILDDPVLLEPFLDHVNPRLRADAITFIAIHYLRLKNHFKQFLQQCVDLVRSTDPDEGVRQPGIQALGWLCRHAADPRLIVELSRPILDPGVNPTTRAKAYATLVSSIDSGSVRGGVEAFLKINAIVMDHQPLSDFELNFVRSVLARLCPSGAGYPPAR